MDLKRGLSRSGAADVYGLRAPMNAIVQCMRSELDTAVRNRTSELEAEVRQYKVLLAGETAALQQLELELRQVQKLASVGRLAAGIAHEINTPVQFISDSVYFVRDAMTDLAGLIQGFQRLQLSVANGTATAADAEALVQAATDADLEYLLENVPKALGRSLEGVTRVATIVHAMKEFAHPDDHDMSAVDLNQAIRSTLTMSRGEYKYVADIVTDFGDIPPVTCHGGDINQVVLNIIVNAAHAVEDVVRGTDHKGRITVQTRREGDAVVIRISDTGAGVPEEIRHRIFDLFFTTKPVGKGTGQGLALARSVVLEKHGGELTLESAHTGTTFIVRLPIAGRAEGRAAA